MQKEHWTKGPRLPVFFVLLALSPVFPLPAQVTFEPTELTVPTLRDLSHFGLAAALSADGNTALVGGEGGETCPDDPGLVCQAAYVFIRSGETWVLQARLAPPDAGTGFGTHVALSPDGNVALVHDPSSTCPSFFGACGAVYAFSRSGGIWVQEAKLFPPSVFDFEFSAFGNALALSGDGSVAFIGKPAESCVPSPCEGAVYVYARSPGGTWTQVDRLTTSDPDAQAFGTSLSLSGDGSLALIGVPATSCAAGASCGAVYVLSNSGGAWSQQEKLTEPMPFQFSFFGSSVGLSADGTVALVGAHSGELPGSPAGSVYVFIRNGASWTLQQRLTGRSGDGFGRFVALSGDGRALLVGAPAADCAAGTECGLAVWSTVQNGVWTPPQPLAPFSAGDLGGFSLGLSADGTTALVGAPGVGTLEQGAALVFDIRAIVAAAIPALDGLGLILLTVALAASGAALLARRRRSA